MDTPTIAGWAVVLLLTGYVLGWAVAFLVLHVPGPRRARPPAGQREIPLPSPRPRRRR